MTMAWLSVGILCIPCVYNEQEFEGSNSSVLTRVKFVVQFNM